MKKLISLFLVTLLVLSCTACGQKKTEQTEQPPAQSEAPKDGKTLKLAVLVPGSINDGAFSSLGYNALQDFAKELEKDGYTVQTSYTEAKSPQDATEGLDNYGAEGYDLIYAHDFAMGEMVERIAPQYPDSLYIVSSGTWIGENFTSVISQASEISYQQGALATMLTKTKKVGLIGADKMPTITRFMAACKQGVTDTDSSVEVVETYLGAQNDLGKAREATTSLINGGCDVILAAVSAATQGVMEGAMEAKEDGKEVYVFTSASNQTKDYPEIFVSTATVDFLAELHMIWDYWTQNGKTLPTEPFIAGVKNQCIVQYWNEDIRKALPAETLEKIKSIEQDIVDKKIIIDIPNY